MNRNGGLQGCFAWLRNRIRRPKGASNNNPHNSDAAPSLASAFDHKALQHAGAAMSFVLVLGALWLLLYGDLQAVPFASGPPPGIARPRVIEVIDGDTLVVEGLGSVRILGIDTPETRHPDMDGPQPLGPAATERLRSLVEGKRVGLEQDQELRDHFGRHLRHVWIGRRLVAEVLAEEGLAHHLIIPPNLGHAERIRAATARARQMRSGLWGLARPTPLSIFGAAAP
jgi:endonuclease YncB( thermonuclease family)